MRLPRTAFVAPLVAALLATLAACGTDRPGPAAASPTTSPASALPRGALAPGTYTTSTTRRAFRVTVTNTAWESDGETADGFTLRTGSAAMGVLAFERGATTVKALLRTFRTTDGLKKSADEVTRPVDGNDAWHLTWRTTKDVRLIAGGHDLTFGKGEQNHAIVVDAPNAPVLVLMAATNDDFRTVYDEGHMLVFAMGIGP
jgi:hypothetical protein